MMDLLVCQVPIDGAFSLYYFRKESLVQQLLHAVKYQAAFKLAEQLSRVLVRDVAASLDEQVDAVIPVPISENRRRKRGYNQCELPAKIMAGVLEAQYLESVLYRNESQKSQTQLKVEARFQNVQSSFELRNPHLVENKSVLIYDDLCTTGSTLVACVMLLKKVKGCRVRVVTLARATNY